MPRVDAADERIIEILKHYQKISQAHQEKIARLTKELNSPDDLIRQIAVRSPQLDRIPVSKTNTISDLQSVVDSVEREKDLESASIRELIVKYTWILDQMNRVWSAYLNLPVAEKETLEALYVKGISIKDFSNKSQQSMFRIYSQRRKGLDDIRAAMGWTAAETENS